MRRNVRGRQNQKAHACEQQQTRHAAECRRQNCCRKQKGRTQKVQLLLCVHPRVLLGRRSRFQLMSRRTIVYICYINVWAPVEFRVTPSMTFARSIPSLCARSIFISVWVFMCPSPRLSSPVWCAHPESQYCRFLCVHIHRHRQSCVRYQR